MSRTKVPPKMRAMILSRDGHRCLWCGRNPTSDGIALNVDHVIPEAFGGKTTIENLGTLCNTCNNGKGADYYGNYLLTTLMEIGSLDKWIKHDVLEDNLGLDEQHHDAEIHKVSFPFYIHDGGNFQLNDRIYASYRIHGSILATTDVRGEMRVAVLKKEAILELKDRLRKYLIRNNGYLKLVAGRPVFYERGDEK